MSKRTRLTADESRAAALEAARALLLEGGPQAVTLTAVAARIGRTHANLIHHFGSANGLQRALAADMIAAIGRAMTDRIVAARAEGREAEPRLVVDLFFDAFRAEGGALAAWLSLTSDPAGLAPLFGETRALIEEAAVLKGEAARVATLGVMVSALGDALIGGPLSDALGLPRETARAIAVDRLATLLAEAGPR
jgi:AcrR family transcriptional regulator